MLSFLSVVNSVHTIHAAMRNFNKGDFSSNKIYMVDLLYITVCEVNFV